MAGALTLLRGCCALLWALRVLLLAIALGCWLAGYFLQDGWEHRAGFRKVLPFLLLNGDLLVKAFRETRWLWAVAALLGFQLLSRAWSGGGNAPVSTWSDVLMVLALTTALVVVGRRELLGRWMIAGLTLLAVVVTACSLIQFYGADGQGLASDRLRNIYVYPNEDPPGLNPVLTGILAAFGAVGAAWFTRRREWGPGRVFWLGCLALLVFGVMTTQSRGAMLAGGCGLAVLVYFLRGAMGPVVAITGASVGAYFLAVLRSDTAADLIERGSSGRIEIYQWFLGRVTAGEAVIGRGMGADIAIPEKELGWFVDHPHSAFLTQFLLTGMVGLGLLCFVLGWAVRQALREAHRYEARWLALLGCGLAALVFDCGQIFSLHSAPRIEFLLVVVPAALLMGRVGAEQWGEPE